MGCIRELERLLTTITRTPCGTVVAGSTFRPLTTFSAGDPVTATVDLGMAEVFERQPPEYYLARLHWQLDAFEDAAAIVSGAIADVPPGNRVHLIVQAAQPDAVPRIQLAQRCGLRLFQENEGFWWTADNTGDDPTTNPVGLTARPLTDSDHQQFCEVMRRSVVGIQDRVDQMSLRAQGGSHWAADLLDRYATGSAASLLQLGIDPAGTAIGFVGLAAEDDDTEGIIVHIGVLPEHRGHRYGSNLLTMAKTTAVTRSWRGLLSLVDLANQPMVQNMTSSGFSPNSRPWHKWHYLHET